ncbi:MAG: hypothetical protein AAF378_07875 [Cyanobacteria bacterium P01_A01_bin.84]
MASIVINHKINQSIKYSLALLVLVTNSFPNLIARADEAPAPIFGDITIGSKFSPDPLTVSGMSGGSIPGKKVAGRSESPTGPCAGFFDPEPDHTLKLTSKFDYLKLQVKSPEDTTMIIKGPGGSWCNDDLEGKNPGIVGEWLPGKYEVWIGSYHKNKYLPYELQVSETR